ncbi:MAG: hypothetical protein AMK75_06680 [Planctomycetes bacterium SM23_65]|nr:MAG: hypothetical protein AMK75_06680 [Planctomycetes bacterium SM23_65]
MAKKLLPMVLPAVVGLFLLVGASLYGQPRSVYQYWTPIDVREGPESIQIAGKRFEYVIDRKHGLFSSTKLLGEEFLAPGAVMPDMFVSPESDCRKVRFEARWSPKTSVKITERSAEQVLIVVRGRYADKDGKTFPMDYELTYRIEFDGFVKVSVKNVATEAGTIRWICFNRARIDPRRVEFWARNNDLGRQYDYGPSFDEAQKVKLEGKSRFLFGGMRLPFLHLGNRKTGIEFYQGDFRNMTHGYKDGEAGRYGSGNDAMGFRYLMTEVFERSGAYELQMMSIRDSFIPIRKGWARANSFMFCLTPTRETRQDLEQMRVCWVGPHQWRRRFVHPDEDLIRAWAEKGINVIIGGANYRSGDYANPDNPEEVKKFIAACHKHGIRVIPYVTFSDLNHTLPVAREHLEEWMVEPKTEYRYITTLMCFGCRPWREHWKTQVEALLDRFGFDGLYIDYWGSTLACVNQRHGCGNRFKRYNIEGLREFAKIARKIVAEKCKNPFIVANSGGDFFAAATGLFDVRLVGENTRFAEQSPETIRLMLDGRRQGCQVLLLTRHLRGFNLVSFALAYNAPFRFPQGRVTRRWREGDPIWKYWDVFRAFGIAQARTFTTLRDPDVLSASNEACFVTAWSRKGELLLVLANVSKEAIKTKLRLEDPERLGLKKDARYRLYDCLARTFIEKDGRTIETLGAREFTVDPAAPRLLRLTPLD